MTSRFTKLDAGMILTSYSLVLAILVPPVSEAFDSHFDYLSCVQQMLEPTVPRGKLMMKCFITIIVYARLSRHIKICNVIYYDPSIHMLHIPFKKFNQMKMYVGLNVVALLKHYTHYTYVKRLMLNLSK